MEANENYTPTRVCTNCKFEKPATADFFHARKKSPDGRREVCKECRAKFNADNGEEIKRKKREHYAKNKEKIIERSKKYYFENLDKQRELGRNRHHRNREVRLLQMSEYREVNRESILEAQRARSKKSYSERYGNDLQYTLAHRVKSLVRVSLCKNRKSHRMIEILGFSVDELRAHLERQFNNGMSWKGFLNGEIHIDHIVPIAAFNITSDTCDEFKACWSLSNLRPMWASENCSKSDKRIVLI